jgi:hypothetical protein
MSSTKKKQDDYQTRLEIASNRRTSPKRLAKFVEEISENDPDWRILQVVAENRSTPPAALAKLAEGRLANITEYVAMNPRTPVRVLEMMANGEGLVGCVAGNPSLPIGSLLKLAQHKKWFVRSVVAENKSTPPEILEKLALDSHSEVLRSVIDNPRTPTWARAGAALLYRENK